ncbi:hypothetical protein [Amycolatopsis sp. NPDC051371]|uniref:hypothetical protein n=1 Tax=Amycolatopsis sp. NPDC051371 TaxID=3155800 RepID=UPI0034327AEC
MNDWPAPEVHAVWVSWTALVESGTVAQVPVAGLTIVLVNVAAAFAGTTTAAPATSKAAKSTGRLIGFLPAQKRKEPYGPLRIAVFWLGLKCVFG